MSKTRDELIRKALQVLGVVNGSDPVDASDSDLVSDMIEPMLSDLAIRGAYNNGSPEQFGDAEYPFLAIILAGMVAADFGAAMAPETVQAAENRLRAQKNAFYGTPTLPGQFY